MRERSVTVAAAVNGLIMLILPLAVMLVGASLGLGVSNDSPPARPASHVVDVISFLIQMGTPLLPLSIFVGWRTSVYARRRRARQDGCWRAVLEAGGCGLVLALLVLAPGIVTRPMEAPPYVITYGGAALLLGLSLGLLLRTTALLVLKVCGPAAA